MAAHVQCYRRAVEEALEVIPVVKAQAMASAKAAVKKAKAERQVLGVKVERQLAAPTKQKEEVGLELEV